MAYRTSNWWVARTCTSLQSAPRRPGEVKSHLTVCVGQYSTMRVDAWLKGEVKPRSRNLPVEIGKEPVSRVVSQDSGQLIFIGNAGLAQR